MAGKFAHTCRAHHLLLTHFSQRYIGHESVLGVSDPSALGAHITQARETFASAHVHAAQDFSVFHVQAHPHTAHAIHMQQQHMNADTHTIAASAATTTTTTTTVAAAASVARIHVKSHPTEQLTNSINPKSSSATRARTYKIRSTAMNSAAASSSASFDPTR